MILDRRQSPWAVGTGIAAALLLGVYVVYATLAPNGARGGSLMGLFFGSLGTGVIVFECLLSLRKRYPASPLGREFWRADPMVDQIIADEVFNLMRGGVGKARPKKAELRRRFFGYAAPIPTEADPR